MRSILNRLSIAKFGTFFSFYKNWTAKKTYGATNTPHVYVLSKKEGKLKVEYIGAIDNNADDNLKADKKYVEEA